MVFTVNRLFFGTATGISAAETICTVDFAVGGSAELVVATGFVLMCVYVISFSVGQLSNVV